MWVEISNQEYFHCASIAYLCKHSNLPSSLHNCSPEFEIKSLLRDEMLPFSECVVYSVELIS